MQGSVVGQGQGGAPVVIVKSDHCNPMQMHYNTLSIHYYTHLETFQLATEREQGIFGICKGFYLRQTFYAKDG